MGDKIKIAVLEGDGGEEFDVPVERDLTADIVQVDPTGTRFDSASDDVDLIIKEVSEDLDAIEQLVADTIDQHEDSIDNHDDVDTSTNPPNVGDRFQWSGTAWIPFEPPVPQYGDYYNSASQIFGVGTGIVTLNTTRDETDSFTRSSSEVTCSKLGKYSINFDVNPDDGANNDITYDIFIEVNGVEVPATRSRLYHDSNDEEVGCSGHVILTLNDTDVIRLGYESVKSSGLDTLAGGVRLSIKEVASAGASGPVGPEGPAGPRGAAKFISGSGAPIPSLGEDGDFYIDSDTADYYIKDAGVWTLEGNLGPTGLTTELKYRKVYIGERNSTGTGKLAYGNGSTTDTMGAVVTEDGELTTIGVSTSTSLGGTDTWEIYINNVSVGATISHTGSTTVLDLPIPIAVSRGDYLNAERITNAQGGNHTVTFEVETSVNFVGLKGEQGDIGEDGAKGEDGAASITFGAGAPANPAPTGSVYFDESSGDVYKENGSNQWVFSFNTSTGSGPQTVKITNTLANNINSSTAGVNFSSFDSSRLIDDLGALITVNNGNITINAGGAGRYELYARVFMNSTVQRSNVGLAWEVNGQVNNSLGGTSYIRSSAGHNEASSEAEDEFQLNEGDVITLRCVQLAASGTVTTNAGASIFYIRRIK